MRLVSWNVNGLRAIMKKGFIESVKKINPDVLCLQETKMQEGQIDLDVDLEEYEKYFNSAQKKGYSGTAIFSKVKPINVTYGMDKEEHDKEGRIITVEYDDFYLVNVYTPNSKTELERLEYRMIWEDEFRYYLKELEKTKPVIVCGDLNVAHKEIDLKNPSSNRKSAGFTDEERNKFTELLDAGFIDTFRYFYPDKEGAYTWWSYLTKARERNAGWRIDYFLVSESLKDRLVDAKIHSDIYGSDHCPVELEIK
ncbi:exodeoxyribonuclease III [Soehngenia longivitae]|uniref:Exodeoxyribonuclease III n=1 Tax=Soehngenia longivitae TaxID=2562294 RepID=A0A4Z0D927_9FIRM|nr:exodeoxyribonuclease III [Soehngenia longivitae]TFZ41355.1 exodeoxyribonuclease III [Soehngenia longivitae]